MVAVNLHPTLNEVKRLEVFSYSWVSTIKFYEDIRNNKYIDETLQSYENHYVCSKEKPSELHDLIIYVGSPVGIRTKGNPNGGLSKINYNNGILLNTITTHWGDNALADGWAYIVGTNEKHHIIDKKHKAKLSSDYHDLLRFPKLAQPWTVKIIKTPYVGKGGAISYIDHPEVTLDNYLIIEQYKLQQR